MPLTGESKDFDPSLVEAGVHELRLYMRPHLKPFRLVSSQKVVFEAGLLQSWKSGQTVGGMVNHRDTNVRNLLPGAV